MPYVRKTKHQGVQKIYNSSEISIKHIFHKEWEREGEGKGERERGRGGEKEREDKYIKSEKWSIRDSNKNKVHF